MLYDRIGGERRVTRISNGGVLAHPPTSLLEGNQILHKQRVMKKNVLSRGTIIRLLGQGPMGVGAGDGFFTTNPEKKEPQDGLGRVQNVVQRNKGGSKLIQ